jgi:hypothetical protein
MMKKVLFATMFMAVVSASALSLRQLGTSTHSVLACGSACSRSNLNCQKPCYCFGLTDTNPNGVCQPEGPAPSLPK